MNRNRSKKNKVKFNIKNVHYALKKDDGTGYEVPVAVPGAVSVSFDAKGELKSFYADGIAYYVTSSNGGYEGDLEMALIPDQFRLDILNEKKDQNCVMVENVNAQTRAFALGFDIDGDIKSTRFWFLNCTATRPSTESSTTEDSTEPSTDKITLTCAPNTDGNVRVKTTEDTPAVTYDGWYDAVYLPVHSQGEEVEPPAHIPEGDGGDQQETIPEEGDLGE